MKKLIELKTSNEAAVVCDNDKCDFELKASSIPEYNPNNPIGSIKPFVNVACPMCGENLLTEHDFNLAVKFYSVITWLNKWFSWITIFVKDSKKVERKVSFHNEIKIQ